MRSNIADYNAVVEAASKFTRSVAEGNSKYAKELFTEDYLGRHPSPAPFAGFISEAAALFERNRPDDLEQPCDNQYQPVHDAP